MCAGYSLEGHCVLGGGLVRCSQQHLYVERGGVKNAVRGRGCSMCRQRGVQFGLWVTKCWQLCPSGTTTVQLSVNRHNVITPLPFGSQALHSLKIWVVQEKVMAAVGLEELHLLQCFQLPQPLSSQPILLGGGHGGGLGCRRAKRKQAGVGSGGGGGG